MTWQGSLSGQMPIDAFIALLLRERPGASYPPYDLIQTGHDQLRIDIAAAGFPREALSIQLQGALLTVRGQRNEASPDDSALVYLHRGLALRPFQRVFQLADGTEVERAEFRDGLLSIHLRRVTPVRATVPISI